MPAREFVFSVNGRNGAGATSAYKYATTGYVDGSTFVEGRLKVAGVLDRHAYSENKLLGRMQIGQVAVTLQNLDGALDTLRQTAFFNEDASILELDPVTMAPLYGTFGLLKMYAEQPIVDERHVTFSLWDSRGKLDRPYTNVRYAGTNTGSPAAGIEGTDDDIGGHTKPLLLGKVYNISPPRVNADKLIYQLHGVNNSTGTVGGVSNGTMGSGDTITVYDRMVPLQRAGTDYINQADMENNAPLPGQYRVWVGGGCFRLGSEPVGRITADVTRSSGFLTTRAIVNQIVRIATGLNNTDWVVSQFNALFAPSPGTTDPLAGIYLTDERNVIDALSELLAGVSGFYSWMQSPGATSPEAELPYLLQLSLPANSLVAAKVGYQKLILTETDVLGEVRPVIPNDDARGMPVWKVTLGYKKNYTVMSEEECSGSVSKATIDFVTREYREVYAEDSSVRTQWPHATELKINTLLVNKADAQAEANRLLTMFKQPRDMFKVKVHFDAISLQAGGNPRKWVPGWVVNFTYPRFGLNAGKDLIIVGMQEDFAANTVEFTLWG